MISAFPVLGMLLADLYDNFKVDRFGKQFTELAVQVLLLIVISQVRLTFKIPLSGHILLFSYFIFRRAPIKDGFNKIAYYELLVCIVFLIITGYVKIFWWTDWITLLTAVLMGGLMGLGSVIFHRQMRL